MELLELLREDHETSVQQRSLGTSGYLAMVSGGGGIQEEEEA